MPGRRGPSLGCGLSGFFLKETGPAEREIRNAGRAPGELSAVSQLVYRHALGGREGSAPRALPERRTPLLYSAPVFDRVLIANRGEIAIRVIRACRELGVGTVAVYSEADAECLHVRYADEAVCIGPPPAAASYLVMPAIVQAALQTGADAIHPGYGFLAERAEFSALCREQGVKFIGPVTRVDRPHGRQGGGADDDDRRRRPGHSGLGRRDRGRRRGGSGGPRIGLPVMVKAAAGGGGKGIRIVHDAVARCRRGAPGPGRGAGGLRQRRRLRREVHHGAAAHRDPGARRRQGSCDPPRRARLLDPAAPPEAHRGGALAAVSADLRRQMGEAAVAAAVAAHYEGAGTVEFLLDPRGASRSWR